MQQKRRTLASLEPEELLVVLFDERARNGLRERLDYEFWLLEFVTTQRDFLHGRRGVTSVRLRNRQPAAHVAVSVTEVIGGGAALKAYDAMAPLLFAAAFKVLDAVFEWIISENHLAGAVQQVPWRFKEKIQVLESTALDRPSLFRQQPWLYDYTYGLYKGLIPYRNEVIHNRGVTVNQGALRITVTDRQGGTGSLDLNDQGIDHLIRFSGQVASALVSEMVGFREIAPCLRFYLNSLQQAHGLVPFDQPEPLRIAVELTVPAEGDVYPADLRAVRDQVSRIHPGRQVLFDLTIVAEREGRELARWRFDAASVPDDESLTLSLLDYPALRVEAVNSREDS